MKTKPNTSSIPERVCDLRFEIAGLRSVSAIRTREAKIAALRAEYLSLSSSQQAGELYSFQQYRKPTARTLELSPKNSDAIARNTVHAEEARWLLANKKAPARAGS